MISERAKHAGLKELEIFDNFQIDYNLPKHKPINENKGLTIDAIGSNVTWSVHMNNNDEGNKLSIKNKFKNWLIRKLTGSKNEKKCRKKITVVEFFISLTKSFKELSSIADVAQYYEKAIIQAQIMGQVALLEKLQNMINLIRSEAYLIAINLKKYVTEEQIIDFYEKVGQDKNLKLTWIKNFSRIIPEEIYKIKNDVDERKIFDNYVILHFDPKNNGDKLTKKEIEKRKDPILFGLIKDSKKLYYIADWKDDYCDLTLEEMFKTLGSKVLEINNKNVKTFIDKTIG